MQRLLCLILMLMPGWLFAQMPFAKCLKKLDLQPEEVVYSPEKLVMYPRGFFYDLNKTDSVGYFACFSTDQDSFQEFIEQPNKAFLREVGTPMTRIAGPYVDSIPMQAFPDLQQRLHYRDGSAFQLKPGTKKVVVYYWNSGTFDRFFARNFRYFRRYIADHPKLGLQLIAVCTDDLEPAKANP